MLFSLIVATVDRTTELERLLASLARQTFADFEVIVVDQNSDSRLHEVLNRFRDRVIITHLTCHRGRSKALNAGLQHVMGEIVVFPDDDCWYPPDLLRHVAEVMNLNPAWGGLCGRPMTVTGKVSGGRWDTQPGFLTEANVWKRAISFTIFLRFAHIKDQQFDEALGVGSGTPWGAGEETDFVLAVMRSGSPLFYDPSLRVYHPPMFVRFTASACAKALSYGYGMGHVLRKNDYPMYAVGYHLMRPFVGSVLCILIGRVSKARYHWATFRGRIGGWLNSFPATKSTARTVGAK